MVDTKVDKDVDILIEELYSAYSTGQVERVYKFLKDQKERMLPRDVMTVDRLTRALNKRVDWDEEQGKILNVAVRNSKGEWTYKFTVEWNDTGDGLLLVGK